MFTRFLNWLATFSPAYQQEVSDGARTRKLTYAYAAALRDIVNTTDAVKVPNGTTRKVARIAHGAFQDATRVLYS